MKSLLIVYHSQSGACFELARAAAGGAQLEAETELIWRRAWDAGIEDLRACQALLLVAAENSATVAGTVKDFLDRCFYPAQSPPIHLAYGLIISAGNDGRGAEAQLSRILRGIPAKPVAAPVICRGEVSGQHLAECRELGQALAAGLALGIF